MKYNDDIFEQMVKATLENGQEEVPESLWEGIRARLEMESAPAAPAADGRSRRWWGVLAGLAVAASVVSAVIFIHPAATPAPMVAVVTEPEAASQPSETQQTIEALQPVEMQQPVEPAVEPVEQTVEVAEPTVEPAETALASSEGLRPETTESKQPQTAVSAAFQTNAEDVEFPEESPERKSYLSSVQFSANGNAGNNMGENSLPVGRKAAPSLDFSSGESLSETENTYFGMPLTFGLGVKFNLKGRWAIGVGLNYTFLDRRFKAYYNSGAVETFEYYVANTQHYIGIPVNLYYNFAMPDRFKFYAFAGAAFEKNVGCKYSFDYDGSPKVLRQKVGGIQSSANIGLGVQFALTDYLCLYLDPSFRYFFPTSSQPRSVRTVQPCQINCELGLRFDL